MHTKNLTDRRSFLKSGAVVAAPLAIIAPAAVMADDGSRAKLARLEDERAIAALTRDFLRQFTGDAAAQCRALLADNCAISLTPGVQRISAITAIEDVLLLDDSGTSASASLSCTAHEAHLFEGDTTIERILRWQGDGIHHTQQERALDLAFSKGRGGWKIVQLQMT